MQRFLSYNTSDTATGNQPLGANGTFTLGPLAAGGASKVAGSIFADQGGTLLIQQGFDYWLPGNYVNPSPHWDATTSITVAANTPQTIDADVIAPVIQVNYTNGATGQGAMRLFLRVFGPGR